MTAVSYDTRTRTKRTQYADGTETVIVYDECGNVLSATNESGSLSYAYDKAGMLIKETDGKTGETVSYFYDKAGRRTRLVSRERDISYGYGKNSELLTQKDRLKQLEVHYKYDVCGRETERRFGNGIVQKTRYDKAGRTVSIAQYTGSGNLISGEAYVYDNVGRRSHTVNEKGLVTVYKYDNQSRLETVYYPFNEDIKETARKETDKQGLYFQPSQGNPENYFLSSAELMQLRGVAENFARLRGNAITTNQVVWKESYTYDTNGNRTSKTTAWGTVEYSYDKENRLIESGELGKSESVKYTYDANGNLLHESAARYRKDYTYNAQNRMSFSDVQDSVLNTRNFTEYAYDAFGRRIETKQYLGDYTRNLYDGFSFDVIGKSVLQAAYASSFPEQKYRDNVNGSKQPASSGRNAAGTEIGTRYRYIDENPLVPMTEAGKANSTNAASSASGAKTRSRPNNEYVLYSYGEPVAMSADGNANYFGTDILGSVRSVTDKYGTVQADYSYDAFGSPYLGNLENDIGFGYCGKVYDNGTGLYDYGFRDYSPNNARFTTIDPIRDGSNWFCYVVNDPVNYYDPNGLKVVNNSSNPIIIKLETSGYVILKEGAIYDGKIDGIIYPDGRIEKVNGKSWLPTVSVIVSDSTVEFADTKSFIINLGIDIYKGFENVSNIVKDAAINTLVFIPNTVSKFFTGEKIFSESNSALKEFSGTYYSNSISAKYTETGKWIDSPVPTIALDAKLDGKTVAYVKTKESLNNLTIIGNVTNGLLNNYVKGIGGLPLPGGCTK